MVPISKYTVHGIFGYKPDQFYDEFIEICSQHRSKGRAKAFLFILYDFRDSHIPQVLENAHYWRALHEKSGNHLTVFSFHFPKDQYSEKETPKFQSNRLHEKYFPDEATFSYPSLLFFQIHGENVLDHFFINLKKDRAEDSFKEIMSCVSTASDALSRILDKYSENSQEIFNCVRTDLEGLGFRSKVSWVLKKKAPSAIALVSALKSFL